MSVGYMKDGELVTAATKDDLDSAVASLEAQIQNISVDYTVGSDGTYYVYTVAGLQAWAAACSSSPSTSCVLMNSLDMSDVSWTPVGASTNAPYTGTFDGAGHALVNFTPDYVADSNSYRYYGLIGFLGSGGVIKGLSVNNSTLTIGPSVQVYASFICGYCNSSTAQIFNCTNSGNITISSTRTSSSLAYIYTGGMVGYVNSGIISGCINSGTFRTTHSTGYNYNLTGGMVGQAVDCTISGCVNSGSMQNTGGASSNYSYAGGMVGQAVDCTISGCVNSGSMQNTGTHYASFAGGIIGRVQGSVVSGCVNSSSSISTQGTSIASAGGLAGASASSTIQYCANTGTATDYN